jgi:hypothetical protein
MIWQRLSALEEANSILTFTAAIQDSDTTIVCWRWEEAGFIKLQHYWTAEQIQALLNLRGSVETVTITEQYPPIWQERETGCLRKKHD